MAKHVLVAILLLGGSVGFWSQKSTQVDTEKEKAELLKLHQTDRQAHFKTDPDLLLSNHPDEFISVSQGMISRRKKADTRKTFETYFKNATYHEWDDLEPPIIRVSSDGSIGWIITRLKVRRTQKDANGLDREQKFVYAGIMTYEKQDGKWVKVANVSTFE